MTAHFRWNKLIFLVCFLLAGLLAASPAGAQSTPVVRAVLFYRSTCSHCIQLVTETLPPIVETYGDRLQIFYCNVSSPAGDALFSAAIKRFSILTIGTPTLVVGSEVLIGSIDIGKKLPGLIDSGLAQGGTDWPDIPGLQEAFATAGSMQMPDLGNVSGGPSDLLPVYAATVPAAATPAAPSAAAVPTPVVIQKTMAQNFGQDLAGNSLAVAVLIGMVIAGVYGMRALFRQTRYGIVVLQPSTFSNAPTGAQFIVPLLCIIGAGVAGYLAYIEITLAEAICGPVGRCDVVQSSSYARLFGVLPIGVLGLGGYAAILLAWLVIRFGGGKWAGWARVALGGLTACGLLFSIYLTFLEPFIIGATCLWCLTSAVVMTLLFLLTILPGRNLLVEGPAKS